MPSSLILTIIIFGIGLIAFSAIVGVYVVKKWREYQEIRKQQLQQSEQKYASLFHNVSDIVFVHDINGIIEEVNLTVQKELGYLPEEVIGRSMLEFVTPEENPLLGNYLEGVQRLGEFSGLVQIRAKDGTYKVFDYKNTLVKEKGKPVAVRGIARNVTERERARQALIESEERYRLFFEQDLTGDFIATTDGEIISCNPAFAQMFGYQTTEEVLSTPFSALFPTPQAFEAFLNLLNEKSKINAYETQLIDKNGKPVYIIGNAIGIFDEQNCLTGIRGYFFNNTERKMLETQLLHFQKMQGIGTLAGGVAHDFNNILSIIKGHASILEAKFVDLPLSVNKSVEAIQKAVTRGSQLVEQILTFARKAEINFKPVNLTEIVREIISLLSGAFPRSIEFKLDMPEAYYIRGDQGQIHQALLNLCVNARDAMPNGGCITISTSIVTGKTLLQKHKDADSEKFYIQLSVSDTGEGMDNATKERLFEPFFSTKQRQQGTGLGLSVVYGIISSHFGFIDVESEPGKGTTFIMYFPQIEKPLPEAPSEEIAAEISISGKETILIVEDEEMLVDLLSSTFLDSGYRILVARDGIEAVQTYRKNIGKIDLIFSDSGLPKLSGWEAFKRIRQIDPGARAVFASGFYEPEIRSQMSVLGVEKVIPKPYSPIEILKIIREIFDKSK